MKVLDLQCDHGHAFEGWFGSEEDFLAQCEKSMVQCPVCGDVSIVKKLSAPRLNLSGSRAPSDDIQQNQLSANADSVLAAAWFALARQVVANTTDVGNRFAEEARKMHYQEADERAIRGTTTRDEALSLMEEGIDVVPFVLPEALKGPLQ
jgi:hypothetical protein